MIVMVTQVADLLQLVIGWQYLSIKNDQATKIFK